MFVKHIVCQAKPGQEAEFLARQEIWNDAMAAAPGFVACQVLQGSEDPQEIVIVTFWQDSAALERFMAGTHDRVEQETAMRDLYEAIHARFYELVSRRGECVN